MNSFSRRLHTLFKTRRYTDGYKVVKSMRFMERATSAIRYHRRGYCGEALIVLVFLLASLALGTLRHANSDMRKQFLTRLDQLAEANGHAATQVVNAVRNGYATLADRYVLLWWGLILVALLISLGLGWWAARRRTQESEAYLMIGKGVLDITAQYVVESLIIFLVTFLLVTLLFFLYSDSFDHFLMTQARQALTSEIGRNVSNSSLTQSIHALFSHKITEFTGPGLFFPGTPNGPAQPPHQLHGTLATFLSGLSALILGQGIGTLTQVSLLRRRLSRQTPVVITKP